MDSFDLTVNNNWDQDSHTFKYSDAQTFMPWSPVELSMGCTIFENGGLVEVRPVVKMQM